ncbi:MAG TPA: DUF2235 domain-containing protein, partial [Vicinamibacteria bacterium]|nr:DUF2235 domain-containing protein [Vicinamibacteria bacterium]
MRVRFVGVWDTVDAVGLPFHLSDVLNTVVYRFKFPDQRLSPIVDEACHALAMDDERHSFHPLLWDVRQDPNPGRIDQVWFAGAHSNVGGGYPKQGMSLVALDWMMAKAEAAGLRLVPTDRRAYRDHANVDDKLYDPRSGAGVFYRWKVRDIAAICAQNGVAPQVHVSVLERIAHGTDDYSPGNLPFEARVVVTGDDAPAPRPSLLDLRAAQMQEVLRAPGTPAGSLLAQTRTALRAGMASYYVYLVAVTLLALVAAGAGDISSARVPRSSLLALPGLGLLLAYGLALVADKRMNAVFSGFWHGRQRALRYALKGVRLRMVETAALAPLGQA